MIEFYQVSCLTKVFCDEAPKPLVYAPEGLIGEECAFQVAFKGGNSMMPVFLKIDSEIAGYIKVFRVRQVPVLFGRPADADDDYLRGGAPGLYPDLLMPPQNGMLRLYPDHWEAVWLSVDPPDAVGGGEYPIKLRLESESGETLAETETVYRRIGIKLPEQTLIHTRWFHCDCLCHYYKLEMFSEAFWRVCGNFMRAAAELGINCLLTPTHTPPLDTRVGGERLTCQLVDIVKDGDRYSFGFEKLDRWIRLAQSAGICYFEIAHLFTQWGAAHAPKIVAEVNGRLKRVFGWETEACGGEYVGFLKQYLPALREELKRLNVLDKCFFHISDEPGYRHIDAYLQAKTAISEELDGLNVIDALSDIEFYEKGIVTKPVPASDRIRPFLDANIPDLWTYYCCGQFKDVSNGFIAMSGARTRVIGEQLYKYDIAGFLQWGFNFYNSRYSDYPVDPYLSTDGDGFSPAGDCFIVYPGEGGEALPSLRAKHFYQALCDQRALRLLEGFIGREETLKLVEEGTDGIEFDRYPKEEDYIFALRHRVNALIEQKSRGN